MFNSVSMAGVGGSITIVEMVLMWFGFEIPGGAVTGAINGLVAFVGLIWLVWGQARRSDIVWGIFRKYT